MGLLDFLKKKKVARPLINVDAEATINLSTPHKKPRKAVKARKKVHRAKARPKRRKK